MDFGKTLDDIIAVFSPETALKRRGYREIYSSAYDASSPSRKDLPFGVDGRAEALNTGARDIILKRSRSAERNSDPLNAMLYALKNNVIGSQINMQADSGDKNFDKYIEDLFHEWEHAENCDITESQSLTDMSRMIVDRFIVDGGILVQYVMTDDKIPLKIQLREVDELENDTTPKMMNGNVVCNGVELNKNGKPVAYYLKKYDPNGMVEELGYERIEAENIDFIWLKNRPSQFREMSQLARSIVRINDIDDYNDTISFKAKVDACSSVFIESDNYNAQPGRAVNTPQGERITHLHGGSVTFLRPGEKAKQVNTSGQATEFENFMVTQLRIMGASHGLSLESASRNVERVNYSSARQNMLADQQTYKTLRKFLVEHFFRKLYKRFVRACYLAKMLESTKFDIKNPNYYKAKWLTEGLPWIDPLKEANANTIQLTNGGMSFQDYCANNGADWKERIDDMAEVMKYAKEKGVNLSFIMPEQNQEEDNEGEQENAEQGRKNPKTS